MRICLLACLFVCLFACLFACLFVFAHACAYWDNLANIHMLTLRDKIILVFLVAFFLNIAKMKTKIRCVEVSDTRIKYGDNRDNPSGKQYDRLNNGDAGAPRGAHDICRRFY